MPRSAVVATAVIGVLVLFASTAFALVRSTQLRNARQQVAALRSELAEARGGGGAAPSEQPSEDDGAADDPLGDLFGDGGGDDLGDTFGQDPEQLAQCVAPAGQLGSRDVGDGNAGAQIEQISDIVTDLRQLDFASPPDPGFLNDQQISEALQDEVEEEYDPREAALDTRLLSTLGAVPADTDLLELQSELLATQVAGYYDPDTGELVVRANDTAAGMDAITQTTLAHELQHAVADQRLELPIDVTENTTDGDAALAALSLIEGDASLTQQQFSIVGLSLAEQLELNSDPAVADAQRQLADVPHYIVQGLQFPYLAGLSFVCSRYLEGGWDAVDATYDALPVTSAEIMDPSRYGTEPVDPRDPGDPGGAWTRARTTTLGAADLQWLFEAPGDDTSQALDDPRRQALQWTGGEVTVWTNGDATAVGVALTQQQADGPLCNAVATWYQRAFPDSTDAPNRSNERLIREGDDQTGVVVCSGDEVRVGIAPDLPTARALTS